MCNISSVNGDYDLDLVALRGHFSFLSFHSFLCHWIAGTRFVQGNHDPDEKLLKMLKVQLSVDRTTVDKSAFLLFFVSKSDKRLEI